MDTQFEDVVKNWEELDWRELDDSPGLKVCAMPVDRDSEATAVAMDYAPGFTIPNHHHTVDHIEVVVRGEITVSGRKETAGAFRFVPRGVIYGPLVAGPEGARVIEFFPDRELESVQGRFTDPAVSAHKNSAERNRDLAAKLGLNF